MTFIRENASTYRPRGNDDQVMFAVKYADGRSAYVRVAPKVASHGELAMLGVARARQATGEIPDGEIAGVQRVR